MHKWTICLLITVLILLSAAAGALCGYRLRLDTTGEVKTQWGETIEDPLESYRVERRNLRQAQIVQLNQIIHDEATDAEIISPAQRQLMTIMDSIDMETAIENVLKIRGFDDVLVSVRSGAASVFLRGVSISSQQATVILECITRETEISGGNVKIIPIN